MDDSTGKEICIRISGAIRSSGLLAFLSPEDLQTFICVLTFVDGSGRCELSARTLGQALNLSEKQAQKRLKKLCGIRWQSRPLVIKESGRERGRFTPTGYQVMEAEGVGVIGGDESEAGMTGDGGSREDGWQDRMRSHLHTNRDGADDGKDAQESGAMPRREGIAEMTKRSSSSGAQADGVEGKGHDKEPVTDSCHVVVENIDKRHTTQGNDAVVEKQILSQLIAAGVSASAASEMMKQYPLERVACQVRMLRFRSAREPAAMLVKAIQDDWAAPSAYMAKKRQEAAEKAKMEAEARESEKRRIWQRRIDEAKEKLPADELQGITRTAREKVRRDLSGIFHGRAPESLVKAEINRIISEKYIKHG